MTTYLGSKPVGISSIVKQEVPKVKFGATVDTFIGDVDENGMLQKTTWTGALDFTGVKEIGQYALYYVFNRKDRITSVNLSSLQSIDNYGLYYAFYGCTGLTSADLSSLQSIGLSGMDYAFYNCTALTSANLSSLQRTGDYYGLQYAFYNCTALTSANLSSLQSCGSSSMTSMFYGCAALTSADLSSLQSVDSSCMSYAFYGCTKLTTMSFPSLTSVKSNSFGSSTSNAIFRNCTALTEIHFRADMQATIEAMAAYPNKFGATNATIYFDL